MVSTESLFELVPLSKQVDCIDILQLAIIDRYYMFKLNLDRQLLDLHSPIADSVPMFE